MVAFLAAAFRSHTIKCSLHIDVLLCQSCVLGATVAMYNVLSMLIFFWSVIASIAFVLNEGHDRDKDAVITEHPFSGASAALSPLKFVSSCFQSALQVWPFGSDLD